VWIRFYSVSRSLFSLVRGPFPPICADKRVYAVLLAIGEPHTVTVCNRAWRVHALIGANWRKKLSNERNLTIGHTVAAICLLLGLLIVSYILTNTQSHIRMKFILLSSLG